MRRGARPTEEQEEIPGGDSFLDIMANIVGILVLLVVVVGVRAGRQVTMPAEVNTVDTKAIVAETEQTLRKLRLERQQIERLAEQVAFSSQEAQLRELAREDLALYTAKLQQEIESERQNLSTSDRRTYEIGNQLAQARLQLEDLTREQITLTSNTDDSTEAEPIYFDPTPIVHERVTDQIMLRLQDDKVVYLPVEELEEALVRNQVSLRNEIASQTDAISVVKNRVGPIQGFILRTAIVTELVPLNNGRIRRTRMVQRIEGQGESLAEPVGEIDNPNSRVNAQLALIMPAETVVTLVVYPDSFDVLPEFEQALRERGYRVAKALMDENKPIEFSPTGRTTRLQ